MDLSFFWKPVFRGFVTITFVAALSFFTASTMAAQGEVPAANAKMQHKLPSNLKEYFEKKYLELTDISSTLQDTPYGPRGRLLISGDITPKAGLSADVKSTGDKHERARKAARSFLQEESLLLGLEDMAEVRERMIVSDDFGANTTHLYLQRYIDGVQLEKGDIRINVRPDGAIMSAMIEVVPTPPELYDAVKKKTLSEKDILKIVKSTMASAGKNTSKMELDHIRKYAEPDPPYIFYGLTVEFPGTPTKKISFQMNAFTGEILKQAVHPPVRSRLDLTSK